MAQELEDVEAIETCVEKCIHTFERCLRSQRSEYQNKSHNIRTQTLSIYLFPFPQLKYGEVPKRIQSICSVKVRLPGISLSAQVRGKISE